MAIQTINIGTSANKGDGDPLRTAFTKINANFAELAETNSTRDIQGSVFGDDSTLLVDGVNSTIPGYVSLVTLKQTVAASTDFADFKTRIAAL
ncbi:hypothetical protein OAA22_00270 [bacterium]|jgi:hypothetical protein|nr:hypothetical protein [bacterium]|tara:strand:+ start:552 stop:830 length:279 start_codon:yes stop_codon:yes gene_type:complete